VLGGGYPLEAGYFSVVRRRRLSKGEVLLAVGLSIAGLGGAVFQAEVRSSTPSHFWLYISSAMVAVGLVLLGIVLIEHFGPRRTTEGLPEKSETASNPSVTYALDGVDDFKSEGDFSTADRFVDAKGGGKILIKDATHRPEPVPDEKTDEKNDK
jgi:hypothetical protein